MTLIYHNEASLRQPRLRYVFQPAKTLRSRISMASLTRTIQSNIAANSPYPRHEIVLRSRNLVLVNLPISPLHHLEPLSKILTNR